MKLLVVFHGEAEASPSGTRLPNGRPIPAPVRTFLLYPQDNRVEQDSDVAAYYLLRALEAVHRNGKAAA